jgi:CRP-like cAMP-binding protein
VAGIVISAFVHDDLEARVEGGGSEGPPDETAAAPSAPLGRPEAGPSRAAEQRAIVRELRTANLILNHFPKALFDHMVDHLIPVVMTSDMVLAEAQHAVERLYFPLDGLNSMVRHLEDGSAAEIATGGRGGFTGLSVVADHGFEEAETVVVIPGTALSISATALRMLTAFHPEVRDILMKFNVMLLAQLGIAVACMARHTLDQRLARWLLTASARVGDLGLEVRQDTLALILGVRRTGVSEAISRLAEAGIVNVSRGHVTIRDWARLETRSCECFHEAEYARRRSAPDIVVSPPIPPARLRELRERFAALTAGAARVG